MGNDNCLYWSLLAMNNIYLAFSLNSWSFLSRFSLHFENEHILISFTLICVLEILLALACLL
jgi:hypothetical protein